MIREAIAQVVNGHHLTEAQASDVMTDIMEDSVTPAQFGALVTALRLKGETVDEIAGFASVMRDKAVRLPLTDSSALVDTCGTGGDGRGTFNISTAAAIVAAAGGVRVAKHGNRAASSKCGSADVLEALGVPISLSPADVVACLDAIGITFMLAPHFHPATRFAVGPRREIGIRTVFNILGPLTNPARVRAQVLGVAGATLVPIMAEVLGRMGTERALVVCSDDGTDELTVCAAATVAELRDGAVRVWRLDPTELGLPLAPAESLRGGTAAANAAMMHQLFAGSAQPALADTVALNAAATFYVAGVVGDMATGIALARHVIQDGRAARTLAAWIAFQPANQAVVS